MKKPLLCVVLAFSGFMTGAQAAEITLVPEASIHLNPVNPGRNFNDLVLHAVVLSTSSGEQFQLENVSIEFLVDGHVEMVRAVSSNRLVGETMGIGQMVQQGLDVFLNAQVLSDEGLEGVLGYSPSFATSENLGENQFLMLGRQYFSFDFKPDQVQVKAMGLNENGERIVAESSVAVATYDSAIEYQFPLKGDWLMTSLPSVQSHHRFNPPTEYAVDFFKVDEGGRTTAGTRLESDKYFGFGEDVLAAADGEVVVVINDEVQDRDALTRREGESRQAAGQRIGMYNMKRYASDFERAAAGNIVVIRHEHKGDVEYSAYGHLKTGSVQVQVGDTVEQGQVIAQVGDTGDSAEAHLHFQVNEGPSPFFSKSLPFAFADLEKVVRGLDPGQFVKRQD